MKGVISGVKSVDRGFKGQVTSRWLDIRHVISYDTYESSRLNLLVRKILSYNDSKSPLKDPFWPIRGQQNMNDIREFDFKQKSLIGHFSILTIGRF